MKVKSLSRVQLFANPWTEAYQAPPSMRFSWQEYWSGLPLPFPVINKELLLKKKKIQKMLSLIQPVWNFSSYLYILFMITIIIIPIIYGKQLINYNPAQEC